MRQWTRPVRNPVLYTNPAIDSKRPFRLSLALLHVNTSTSLARFVLTQPFALARTIAFFEFGFSFFRLPILPTQGMISLSLTSQSGGRRVQYFPPPPPAYPLFAAPKWPPAIGCSSSSSIPFSNVEARA